MDFSQAKDLLLIGACGTIISFCGAVFYYLKQLVEAIQELNIKVAVILEKINGHEDRIKRLEDI